LPLDGGICSGVEVRVMQSVPGEYTRLLIEMTLLAVMIAIGISSVFVLAFLVEIGGLRAVGCLHGKPPTLDHRTPVNVRRVS
jgi:hypothetical protein